MSSAIEWTLGDMPDLYGKTAIVTGSNTGIGLEITTQLALKGCRVIMACRNRAKAEAAKEQASKKIEEVKMNLQVMIVDLSSTKSVTKFASEVKKSYKTLDFIVVNAGVMGIKDRRESIDGCELMLASNYLGHFVLVGELLSLLMATPGSKIVFQSSVKHWWAKVCDDLNAEKQYCHREQYAKTKLATVMFAVELQNRLARANITSPTVYSVHPGVVHTDLVKGATETTLDWIEYCIYLCLMKRYMNDLSTGALPSLFCLVNDCAQPGRFYSTDGPCRGLFYGKHPKQYQPHILANDPTRRLELWKESERLASYRFQVKKL